MLIKFTDGRGSWLGGVANTAEGKIKTQGDSDRLGKWAETNKMTVRGKCKVLNLGRKIKCIIIGLERTVLVSSSTCEKNLIL